MYKINNFLYISNEELKYLTKNSPQKLQTLQNNYGEFRNLDEALDTEFNNHLTPRSNKPNRADRRRAQYKTHWRNGFQKNNVEHKTQHKTY